jgi:predicted ribonuclease YlaK
MIIKTFHKESLIILVDNWQLSMQQFYNFSYLMSMRGAFKEFLSNRPLQGQKLFAHIKLEKGERSKLAELASNQL